MGLCANFTSKDLAVHLTYNNDNLPESVDQVKKDIANYIRRIKRRRKKLGLA